MPYQWIKIIHIISASVLFGTGIGTAFYMFLANYRRDIEIIALATKRVVIADAWFTSISGFLQPLTGFTLLYLKHFPFTKTWTITVTSLYTLAACCWFMVVYLQVKCRDLAFIALKTNTTLPARYHHYFISWVLLGIPAFAALIGVFYLMANSPLTLY